METRAVCVTVLVERQHIVVLSFHHLHKIKPTNLPIRCDNVPLNILQFLASRPNSYKAVNTVLNDPQHICQSFLSLGI